MIICSGPGSEEESSSHEKMYFILREGPMHRCIFCGQCFKLVKLKDNPYDEANIYYSSVFTELSHRAVSEPELMPYISFPYSSHDFNMSHQNIMPSNRNYLFVNGDEADHIMVDPAYRMEKYKQLENDFTKYSIIEDEIEKQEKLMRLHDREKLLIPKDIYETWYNVEKAILSFDKLYNRYEKFAARALFDQDNHERRERRMLERKSERENDNYTYFFGGLTEEEQMYRDYYESDIEDDAHPDSCLQAEIDNESNLRESQDFNLKYIELLETNTIINDRAPVEDIIDKALFKYKYRKISDADYEERNKRVIANSLERSRNRDENIIKELTEKISKFNFDNKFTQTLIDFVKNPTKLSYKDNYDELLNFAKYISNEAVQQYKDYYNEHENESGILEILDDLNERDRLRLIEYYENPLTKASEYEKYYVTIPKRQYDYNKSIMSNFVTDLLDFNSRVRPISKALSLRDAVSNFEPVAVNQSEKENDHRDSSRYRKVLGFKKTGANRLDIAKSELKH